MTTHTTGWSWIWQISRDVSQVDADDTQFGKCWSTWVSQQFKVWRWLTWLEQQDSRESRVEKAKSQVGDVRVEQRVDKTDSLVEVFEAVKGQDSLEKRQ